MAQSNGDEEQIMLLALAMHSSQYEKPSDRVDVIKKWLDKYNEADRKQHELEARIDEWDYIHETLHAALMDAVSNSTEVMKERIDELNAERERLGN